MHLILDSLPGKKQAEKQLELVLEYLSQVWVTISGEWLISKSNLVWIMQVKYCISQAQADLNLPPISAAQSCKGSEWVVKRPLHCIGIISPLQHFVMALYKLRLSWCNPWLCNIEELTEVSPSTSSDKSECSGANRDLLSCSRTWSGISGEQCWQKLIQYYLLSVLGSDGTSLLNVSRCQCWAEQVQVIQFYYLTILSESMV